MKAWLLLLRFWKFLVHEAQRTFSINTVNATARRITHFPLPLSNLRHLRTENHN